jgi:hypothetical protein
MKSLCGLKEFKGGKYSQWGEAGILDELLKRLNIESGTSLEFGAYDGAYASNTRHLLESGNWKCVMIEPHDMYEKLVLLNDIFGNKVLTLNMPVNCKGMPEYFEGTSLDEIIEKYCPDVDVVSIDIDTFDYYIFKDLQYRPKIVIIEINACIMPHIRYTNQQNPKLYGTSFLSMLELGDSKGYVLVAATGNLFFVRKDLCEGYKLPEPQSLFDWTYIETQTKIDDSNIWTWDGNEDRMITEAKNLADLYFNKD